MTVNNHYVKSGYRSAEGTPPRNIGSFLYPHPPITCYKLGRISKGFFFILDLRQAFTVFFGFQKVGGLGGAPC
jgi:hypothetical protein